MAFTNEHTPYYVVLHFDNFKEIEKPKQQDLKKSIHIVQRVVL